MKSLRISLFFFTIIVTFSCCDVIDDPIIKLVPIVLISTVLRQHLNLQPQLPNAFYSKISLVMIVVTALSVTKSHMIFWLLIANMWLLLLCTLDHWLHRCLPNFQLIGLHQKVSSTC